MATNPRERLIFGPVSLHLLLRILQLLFALCYSISLGAGWGFGGWWAFVGVTTIIASIIDIIIAFVAVVKAQFQGIPSHITLISEAVFDALYTLFWLICACWIASVAGSCSAGNWWWWGRNACGSLGGGAAFASSFYSVSAAIIVLRNGSPNQSSAEQAYPPPNAYPSPQAYPTGGFAPPAPQPAHNMGGQGGFAPPAPQPIGGNPWSQQGPGQV
ncbi:hypothetical protein HK097_007732 [Rhizophlyctis rosea]|uniref:MARVEL domain-containing protein n=1 Tax=Rhizophlyctis rosea TaxID=64517 RepID=A0AAD5SB97_9FUNG|nr:hypothetical protein HK097_007732 [Rhizophlyctis rosea]